MKRTFFSIINLIFFFIINKSGFIQHNKKSTKCFACQKNTLGIFHQAKEIIKKMAAIDNEKPTELANKSDDDE